MSLDLLAAVKQHTISHRPNETLKLRIGIHTGLNTKLNFFIINSSMVKTKNNTDHLISIEAH
jgi:hypothetical protein